MYMQSWVHLGLVNTLLICIYVFRKFMREDSFPTWEIILITYRDISTIQQNKIITSKEY